MALIVIVEHQDGGVVEVFGPYQWKQSAFADSETISEELGESGYRARVTHLVSATEEYSVRSFVMDFINNRKGK